MVYMQIISKMVIHIYWNPCFLFFLWFIFIQKLHILDMYIHTHIIWYFILFKNTWKILILKVLIKLMFIWNKTDNIIVHHLLFYLTYWIQLWTCNKRIMTLKMICQIWRKRKWLDNKIKLTEKNISSTLY